MKGYVINGKFFYESILRSDGVWLIIPNKHNVDGLKEVFIKSKQKFYNNTYEHLFLYLGLKRVYKR